MLLVGKIICDGKEIEPSVAVYLSSKVIEEEVLGYLNFVENYLEEKVPDYFLQSKFLFINGGSILL